jgi:hypothetical protein
MRNLYGRRELSRFGGFTVSWSGTTLGTTNGMRRYLKAMSEEVSRHAGSRGSHDQGIHNYLLRSRHLSPSVVRANEGGRVITLGMQRRFVSTIEARSLTLTIASQRSYINMIGINGFRTNYSTAWRFGEKVIGLLDWEPLI